MLTMSRALEVIAKHQAGPLPVQAVSLAEDLGIPVYRVPGWPGDLSGMIKRTDNTDSGFTIYVNATHPAVRRRFTIAHECAHAILHPELIGDGITEDALYRSGLSDAVEAQANRLAADILMPRDRLRSDIAQGITDVSKLAEIFWVSEQAMAIRLGVAN